MAVQGQILTPTTTKRVGAVWERIDSDIDEVVTKGLQELFGHLKTSEDENGKPPHLN